MNSNRVGRVLRKVVSTGIGEPIEKWPFSDLRNVNVDEFCQRLRAIVIKRYSVPAGLDDEQKAAKALRSMGPDERKLLEDVGPRTLSLTHLPPLKAPAAIAIDCRVHSVVNRQARKCVRS